MAQIRRSPLEVGSLFHFFQGVIHPNGGWPWDIWTINSRNIPEPAKVLGQRLGEAGWIHELFVFFLGEIFRATRLANFGSFGFGVLCEDRMLPYVQFGGHTGRMLSGPKSYYQFNREMDGTNITGMRCICNLWDIYCLNWNGFGILSNIITTLPRCFQGESFSLTPATAPGN